MSTMSILAETERAKVLPNQWSTKSVKDDGFGKAFGFPQYAKLIIKKLIK